MKKLALLLALTATAALAEPQDAPLAGALGVEIQKSAGDTVHFARGSGVYLGNGLVLTAAHVLALADPANPNATVSLDGWQTGAKLVATGQNGLDLALLKIDPAELSRARREMKPLDICTIGTVPDQSVLVAAQGQVSTSKTVGGPINAPNLKGDWTSLLAGAYTEGASGGGVLDALKGCLAGIIIVEWSGKSGLAMTQFVPAAQITPFLAGKR